MPPGRLPVSFDILNIRDNIEERWKRKFFLGNLVLFKEFRL